jgi:hypothetical protein
MTSRTPDDDTLHDQPDPADDPSTPEGNRYSPNFEPEHDEEKLIKPEGADIDTDGG